MGKITFLNENLVEGMEFQSVAEMCRQLEFKVNNNPTRGAGSQTKIVLDALSCYADISKFQKVEGGNISIRIDKLFPTWQAPPPIKKERRNVAPYIKPLIRDMINRREVENCFICYHKNLTVDLGYMPSDYGKLYDMVCKDGEFTGYNISNAENFARYTMKKLVDDIRGYLSDHCKRLKYEGVKISKQAVDTEFFELLEPDDQALYDECKISAKAELEEEYANAEQVDYRTLPQRAADEFNKRKKAINKNFKNFELIEAYTFEIDEEFKAEPQETNPQYLNYELLAPLQEKCDILTAYIETDEYKNIMSKNEFVLNHIATNAEICNNAEVRQALTRKNRDKMARDKKIIEQTIKLDFPLHRIVKYIQDLGVIIGKCSI